MSKVIVFEDFDDLGNPVGFSFGGNNYEVPAIVPKKSKKLMRMGREIAGKARENEKLVKEYEEKGDPLPDEILDKMDEIFDFQMDFLVEAEICRVVTNSDETTSNVPITKEYMNDNFPNKLINRVFRKVNENFADTEQEKKS